MDSIEAYSDLLRLINTSITPVDLNEPSSYDVIIQNVKDARFVLLGEASHGTREFYQARADITRRLIREKGFMAVVVEGDWPDVYQIHRYVQGIGDVDSWPQALSSFQRFPTWMWRNATLPPFMRWLRNYNDSLDSPKIGFYGMDLYSLHASVEAVLTYLRRIDPAAARVAEQRYACFDHLHIEPQDYGELTTLGIKKACIKEAVEQLKDMQYRGLQLLESDGINEENYFCATQNARIVKNAEKYYRTMFEGRVSSWNVQLSFL